MNATVILLCKEKNKLIKFLSSFYNTHFDLDDDLKWQKDYSNPIELAEIIGIYIDNSNEYNLNMYICLDKNFLISVTPENGDNIIRYLYERFPY